MIKITMGYSLIYGTKFNEDTLVSLYTLTRQLLTSLVSQVVLAPNVGHKDKQEPLWLLGQISKVKIYH